MNEVLEEIEKKSVSLEEFGIKYLAWNKEDATDLINAIIEDDIGVLGGDVYRIISNRLEALYDNWFCEPIIDEPKESYFLRSKMKALSYIKNYPTEPGEVILFALVFSNNSFL